MVTCILAPSITLRVLPVLYWVHEGMWEPALVWYFGKILAHLLFSVLGFWRVSNSPFSPQMKNLLWDSICTFKTEWFRLHVPYSQTPAAVIWFYASCFGKTVPTHHKTETSVELWFFFIVDNFWTTVKVLLPRLLNNCYTDLQTK